MAHRFLTYAELRGEGLTRGDIRRALEARSLIRVRRDRYVRSDNPDLLNRALAAGGRLDCVSLLASLGVFVMDARVLHVQVERGSSRLPPAGGGVVRHWRLTDADRAVLTTDVVEALVQACRCQTPRVAIATLDSAWHRGVVDEADIARVFQRLPARFAALRPHLDPRAEAGTETLVRLMATTRGCDVDLQVRIPTVGRVDLLIDGWLIVECDSREFHSTLAQMLRDRRRDRAAAARGFVTIRFLAEEILYQPDLVAAALDGLLRSRRTGTA